MRSSPIRRPRVGAQRAEFGQIRAGRAAQSASSDFCHFHLKDAAPLMKRTLATCCLIGLGLMSHAAFAAPVAQEKIAAAVLRELEHADRADVLLVFPPARLKPDLQRLPFAERTAAVSAALRTHAALSQAALRQELQAQGVEYQSLWISNSLAVRLSAEQIAKLASRKDLFRIEANAPSQQALEPIAQYRALAESIKVEPPLEAHLRALNVQPAWDAGARGLGVVVGGQDSGYEWNHPALRDRYRGWDGQQVDHQYNWYDGVRDAVFGGVNRCGIRSETPCDDDGHGTHTMGTAVGGGVASIGVAPDARWIGCRNMDRGIGRPSTYLACFQFFLAPTDTKGEAPRPELAPPVIINSWGCPTGAPPAGEDCQLASFDAALSAMKAAGILMAVAAGNGNPGCGTIADPPAISADVLTVGATDNVGAIAPFSLWGPVMVDGSQRLKPDVSAPGVSVLSSVPGGGYGRSSGTSMATPAVVGVSALMLSANPLLIGQPEETVRLLKASAQPAIYPANCGAFGGQASPNTVFGWGRVDASAAVNAATQLTVNPSHSGAWFDPSRNGEGWILHILKDGRASLVWYTYPASGDSGEQAWLVANDGVIDDARIHFDQVYRVLDGRFGAAFDPEALRSEPWGTVDIQVAGCDAVELTYQGPEAFGSGRRVLSRLTQLAGHHCGQPAVPSQWLREQRAGAWFNPARSGEGWLIEPLDGGNAAVTWFTFTPDGEPAWLFGVGTLDAQSLQVDELRVSSGTRFGDQFESSAVQSAPWGGLQIQFDSCRNGRLTYAALDSRWGEGSYEVTHLSEVSGLSCVN